MHGLPLIALLLGSLAVTAVCRRLGLSAPLVLVVVGIVVSLVPGMPRFELDPDLVLVVFIPPLLYSASLDSSALRIRANLRPIGLLAVGLVVFTAAAIGLVAWWLVPGMSLPAALILGAVVAPPDAVAAVAIGRRLGLPRRVMTILGGESLLNDATALTLYRVAVAAATGAGLSLAAGLGMFLLAGVGGIVVGYAIGWLVHRVRLRLHDSVVESALGLLVPFAVYLIAEEVYASGVLAVVIAGLYLGHHAPEGGYASRLQEQAVWGASDTILESVVFGLIGLQLTSVIRDVGGDLGTLTVVGLVLILTAALARIVWVFPATYLPRLLFPPVRRGDPPPRWQIPAVISWAGMRGVVSLAAAFAVPESVPQRSVILFLAFLVTVGTLLLHGLTLPWVIRKLDVRGAESQGDALAEAEAQYAATAAAVGKLDELVADEPRAGHAAEKLRRMSELRSNSVWERLGRPAEEAGESPSSIYRRLRREMVTAERDTFVRFRNEGRIDDVVLRRALYELDLEEAMLAREG